MKKRFVLLLCALLLALCLTAAAVAEESFAPEQGTEAADKLMIDATAFPDAAFRAWVLEHLSHETDAAGKPYMTRAQIDAVTEIDCHGRGIKKLNGVGKFRMLETLDCSGNALTSLNLTGLDSLGSLDCSGNALTSLTLTGCYVLETLRCENNALVSLELRDNLRLEEIDCSHNRLTSFPDNRNQNLLKLNCSDNEIPDLILSLFENLQSLDCSHNRIGFLATYFCPMLCELRCADNVLTKLPLGENINLSYLDCSDNLLTSLPIPLRIETLIFRKNYIGGRFDYHRLENLRYLDCSYNYMKELRELPDDVRHVDCSFNNLTVLEVGTHVEYLDCRYNQLSQLYLNGCDRLETAELFGQRRVMQHWITETENGVSVEIGKLVLDPSRILPTDPGQQYDPETGVMTVEPKRDFLDYYYDTGSGLMWVRVYLPFDRTATVEFYSGAVEYKGDIPYVLYNGERQYPAVRVLDEDGTDVDPIRYDVNYMNNGAPGTAQIRVSFPPGEQQDWLFIDKTFKIYLPATTETTVENRSDGIHISWAAVDGAENEGGGYVIYRRAWSSTTNGWTAFERWNNTKDTEWTDTKVFAGTRYQYGIKAYPGVHSEDGDLVGGPMDNFNLGFVGPLKTTVRITTRELKSVTAGTKQMTVKWAPSKNFTGYQIKYATDAGFTKNVKALKIESASAASKLITGLTSGTTYYVTVRSYHVFNGMTYFGEWSNVLSCKVK